MLVVYTYIINQFNSIPKEVVQATDRHFQLVKYLGFFVFESDEFIFQVVFDYGDVFGGYQLKERFICFRLASPAFILWN